MSEKKFRSKSAEEEVGYVLHNTAYTCFEASERISAVLLRDGTPRTEFDILASDGGHYWVSTKDGEEYSTVDISNLRTAPTVNDRCKELLDKAQKHVYDDGPTFREYIFDTSGKFQQREEDFLNDVIKNYRK